MSHLFQLSKFGCSDQDITAEAVQSEWAEQSAAGDAAGAAEGDPLASELKQRSDKELAAIASSAGFNSPAVQSSADLKALLPQQKMRFMKVRLRDDE